jgi:hypothetical protein
MSTISPIPKGDIPLHDLLQKLRDLRIVLYSPAEPLWELHLSSAYSHQLKKCSFTPIWIFEVLIKDIIFPFGNIVICGFPHTCTMSFP